jgi:hypothetical protein
LIILSTLTQPCPPSPSLFTTVSPVVSDNISFCLLTLFSLNCPKNRQRKVGNIRQRNLIIYIMYNTTAGKRKLSYKLAFFNRIWRIQFRESGYVGGTRCPFFKPARTVFSADYVYVFWSVYMSALFILSIRSPPVHSVYTLLSVHLSTLNILSACPSDHAIYLFILSALSVLSTMSVLSTPSILSACLFFQP